jgi:uncharacterized protein YaiE (UPF0345 family)
MKYVKILGLLAVAAAALMAFAGSASATTITSPTGTVATPAIKAESVGHAILHNPIAKIECHSTVEGKVESHGQKNAKGETLAATGKISKLEFINCTNSWHVTTNVAGSLEVLSSGKGDYNGTVYSEGATVTSTRFGIECRYSTGATLKIGTLTGGAPATMHIEASIPFHSGSSFCGSGATAWTGSYKVTSPTSLYVD